VGARQMPRPHLRTLCVTFETWNEAGAVESLKQPMRGVDWKKGCHQARAYGESAPDRA